MWRGEAKKKQVNNPGDRLLLYKGRARADDGDDVGGEYEDDKDNNDDNKDSDNDHDKYVEEPGNVRYNFQ